VPYQDYYDVMGASWDQVGTLNAVQAAELGMFDASTTAIDVNMLSAEAVHTLEPVSDHLDRHVLRLETPSAVYWMEYRPAAGRDAWLGTPDNLADLEPGVLVRRESSTQDGSLLLDPTPAAQAGWNDDLQTALPVGTPVSLAGGMFTVTVESVSGSGASVRVRPASPIERAYQAAGGSGTLGAALGAETCAPYYEYCFREYQYAVIYWWPGSGARVVAGAILDAWDATGAEYGPLGLPTSSSWCGFIGGGCGQQFQGGSVYWSPATGGHAISGAIRAYWTRSGWESGWLGYPTGDMSCPAAFCTQSFQGGVVTWSGATGTRVLQGAIRETWSAAAGAGGPLGLPTTDMGCGMVAGGCGQQFQGGSVYWAPGLAAHAITGAIRAAWTRYGWESGVLGYPTERMWCVASTCEQRFQRGTVVWAAGVGTGVVEGAIRDRWKAEGSWTAGRLGYPTTPMGCGMVGGGCGQQFQGGSIYWSPATGAHSVSGAIREAWIAQGWERGRLGYPDFPMSCYGSECWQTFQGGRITWSAATGTRYYWHPRR
jgi:hypothetical protein